MQEGLFKRLKMGLKICEGLTYVFREKPLELVRCSGEHHFPDMRGHENETQGGEKV